MSKHLYKNIQKNTQKNIHWIRHAESLSNTSELNYKIIDPGLNSLGKTQASNLSYHINQIDSTNPIDLIIVSPMLRTLQTLDLSCKSFIYKCPIISTELVREQVNELCHKKKEDLNEKKKKFNYIDFTNIDSKDFLYEKFNGMEPESNVINRSKQFIDWIKKRKETNIIVLTHGGFLYSTFNNNVLGLQLNKSYFSNCEIRSIKLQFNNEDQKY